MTLVTILIMMKLLLCQTARIDATLTILVSEADMTAYHEETIAESHDTLQSELEEVYKKKTGREIKENWTCLKNQKCWSLLIRSKNCFQRLVVRVVVPFL